jgi:RNA polymerase sigma-70 factor, ECF subfamily
MSQVSLLAGIGGASREAVARGDAVEAPIDEQVRQLVERGSRRAAMELLAREYGDIIFSNAYRILGSHAAAQDALQQTYFEALRDLATFQNRSSVKTWLLGIGTHRALDVARRMRREEQWQAVEEDGADVPETTMPAAPAALDQRRRTRALEECLRQVSAKVRAALLLRFQHGLSYEEISRSCSARPGTLQARVTRAFPVLRRCLTNKGMEP